MSEIRKDGFLSGWGEFIMETVLKQTAILQSGVRWTLVIVGLSGAPHGYNHIMTQIYHCFTLQLNV